MAKTSAAHYSCKVLKQRCRVHVGRGPDTSSDFTLQRNPLFDIGLRIFSPLSNTRSNASSSTGPRIRSHCKWLELEFVFWASITLLATVVRVVCQLTEFQSPELQMLNWIITSWPALFVITLRWYPTLGSLIYLRLRSGKQDMRAWLPYVVVCDCLFLIFTVALIVILATGYVSDYWLWRRLASALFTLLLSSLSINAQHHGEVLNELRSKLHEEGW